MTLVLTVSCDGYWDSGRMPCRGAFPARSTIDHRAEDEAIAAGWRLTVDGDYCPAHARKLAGW